jgi:RimJ/RimL family protein N-acetyltransferase
MLAWGVANALIQPSLFASAGAVPPAELASGSAVLATARQLGAALGVAIFVAVLGAHPATDLAGFDRAWLVVVITAAMTACAGIAAGGPLTRVPAWTRSGRLLGRRPPQAGSGKTVVLREGSSVLIRPVQSADAPLLADGFDRLSARSREMRFLTRKKALSPAELRYFTDVDHHDHEALGALDHAGGRGVGVARYVRDASDPQAAEIAVTIVDDWQGRGLGTELLARLSDRARQEGIRRFTGLAAENNEAIAGLLRNLGAEIVGRGPGTVKYEILLCGPAAAAENSAGNLVPCGGTSGGGDLG